MREGRTGARMQRAIHLTRDPLEAEERAFERKLPELLRKYEGRFVALYRGRIVGHDKDDEKLGRRIYDKFGEVPFYIAKVERTPTVHEVPSPEVTS